MIIYRVRKLHASGCRWIMSHTTPVSPVPDGLVAALTSANGCRASAPNLGVSRVAPHPAASRAQIWLLTRDTALRVTASVSGLLRDSTHVRQARSRRLPRARE
jgi:hypothetical protein